jgi:hypothetical protein
MKGSLTRRLAFLPLFFLLFLAVGALAALPRLGPLFPPPPEGAQGPPARAASVTADLPTAAPPPPRTPTPAPTPPSSPSPQAVVDWSFQAQGAISPALRGGPRLPVILNDPLPAGLEGLNERLATTSYAARDWWEEPSYGQYPYSRKDVRDGAVALFFTELAPGTHTVTYLARATTAGTFHALPAEAYPMYRPEVWGRSAGDMVVIAP